MADDDLQWSELIRPEDFSEAWRKIKEKEGFELDITDDVLLSGYQPAEYELNNLFKAVHPASIAHRVLKIATEFSQIHYAIFVNDVPIMFSWPMGWTFLPENSYAVGDLPQGWKNMRALGTETVNQLIEDKDTDSHNG